MWTKKLILLIKYAVILKDTNKMLGNNTSMILA